MPEVIFTGPAGRIEGRYHPARQKNAPIAIILHPHPQFGGTMNHQIIYQLYYAFVHRGFSALRFNFRGVGRSRGSFGDGIGEAEDVRAALDWMAATHPGVPLVHCGFSFGNAVGTPVAASDDRVDRLVCLGTPTKSFPFDRLADVPLLKLFVQGEHDEHGPLDELRVGLERVALPRELVVVRGGDHVVAGHLDEMECAIVDYLSASADEPSSPT